MFNDIRHQQTAKIRSYIDDGRESQLTNLEIRKSHETVS